MKRNDDLLLLLVTLVVISELQQPTTSSDMEPDHYTSGATVLSKKGKHVNVIFKCE